MNRQLPEKLQLGMLLLPQDRSNNLILVHIRFYAALIYLPFHKLGIWIFVSSVAAACIHPRSTAIFFDRKFFFLSNSDTLQT